MIGVQDLRKGTTYTEDGQLWRVLEYQHIKTGRGGATIRVKVRNVRSGATLEKTYPSGSRVQDVRLDHAEVQYLYHDGDLYTFMNMETYEQPVLHAEMLGDAVNFLVDNMIADLESYEGEAISIQLPTTVELEIIQTDPGFAGDTATNATKPALVSTGYQVQVPLFVNIGDRVRIDTRTGEYLTRV
ncbi:MAG: Elongation factor P [Chloroflexi bacterium ADurb.Bin325]|nr:MAG: Elongation factor P [Chloroflexi bacterium ADurb.Bin325]